MLDAPYFISHYNSLKATALRNRYITNTHIEPLLKSLSNQFNQTILGTSEAGLPIHGVQIGTGSKRILIWSQMHGNESTTTKALFDLFNYFELSDSKTLLEACTLFITPILNPDGAEAYTRLNGNQIDLNRDAKSLSQSESKILRTVYEDFKPHFCFNMHGQRTIFSAGNTHNSAVLSFLSPSENEERSLTITRQKSMEIIQVMNKVLQPYLPNQIGRYDDGFNDNCVGDYFQSHGTPTVLFEAGHFPKDYNREETRKYMVLALFSAINYVATSDVLGDAYKPYFDIPENGKLFYDVIIRNALLKPSDPELFNDIGIQYTEVLASGAITFKPKVVFVGDLNEKQGHFEMDANFKQVSHPDFEAVSEGHEIDFITIELTKISLFGNDNLT
jgi:murein tripeptide amidase MpaA